MKKQLIIIVVIVLSSVVASGQKPQQKLWSDLKSVKDICEAYPDRMKALMNALDLEKKGLEKVKAAYGKGNLQAACQSLLDYYKKGTTAVYLRKELPVRTSNRNSEADSILNNIYVFYDIPDKVPVRPDGHLEWTWKGRDNDIEWAWGLNRHYHIRTLLSAYSETGNPEYAAAIDRHIKDWITASLPYPGVKSTTEMWRGLEVSFRAKVWAQVFYTLMKSKELTPAARLLILSSIPEHAHYARNFHAQGNWLTMELSGLASDASAWPEYKESSAWISYVKETMIASLKDQVYPDGVQTELTSSYHMVALSNFNLFLETCRQINVSLPDLYNSYLERMWNFLAYSMRPDGYGLLNNDADQINNRATVTRAAEKYNRPDWKYIATNGTEGTKPEGQPSVIFPWAGQIIMRSGYDAMAQYAFFDIGPWGTGHQHNDKLNITVSAFGRDLLVDAGRFAYRGELADKFRGYATGSYGHNLILVDGKGQGRGPTAAKSPLPESSYLISEKFDYASGSFDSFTGAEGKFSHTRATLYVRGQYWVVVDRVSTDRPRKIETLWHFHPDCRINVSGNTITTENEKGNLKIIPVLAGNADIRIVKGQELPSPQGWYSREYNSAVRNQTAIYTSSIEKDEVFVWILLPSEYKAKELRAKVLSLDNECVRLVVENGNEESNDITIPFSDSGKASLK